jgi:hypothetical protein
MVARGMLREWKALLRPVLQGVLRQFGESPRTVFSRIAMLTYDFSRGGQYQFKEIDPKSGRFEVQVTGLHTTKMVAEAWAACCEVVVQLCGTTGTAVVEEFENYDEGATVRIGVSWK